VNRKQSRISALLDSFQNGQKSKTHFDKRKKAIGLRGLDESDKNTVGTDNGISSSLGGAHNIRAGGTIKKKKPTENQIDVVLNGGKTMSGTIKCHCIWYGDWSGSKGISSSPEAQKIIENFISNLGNSNWFKIVKTYDESLNIVLGQSVAVTYLSTDNGLDMTYMSGYNELIVTTAMNLHNLLLDDKSIFLIFPSEDVGKVNVRKLDTTNDVLHCC
jgi:hypothetical protein